MPWINQKTQVMAVIMAIVRGNQIAAIAKIAYSAKAKYPNLPFLRIAATAFAFLARPLLSAALQIKIQPIAWTAKTESYIITAGAAWSDFATRRNACRILPLG